MAITDREYRALVASLTQSHDLAMAVRKIRVVVGLLESLAPDCVVEWGEPDAEGFYEPTFTRRPTTEAK